jgi:UDP-N-acetylglucosamine 2-epimerase (non-hydrolysing)
MTEEVMIALGTRPETIKMAPVIRALQKYDQPFSLVHSGQHYDYNLSIQFIEELNLPRPDHNLRFRESLPAAQTGRIMMGLEKIVKKEKPRLMLIQGDTNTMLAAALTAFKQNVPVGHVEAGLRSNDWRMPEEHNRRMVDHASKYLFAPTLGAKENLESENIWGKIFVTGNTVIDAVAQHLPIAEKKSVVMTRINFREYILATAHRAENVDDPRVLRNFVEVFMEAPLPVVFPVHPRTAKRLRRYNLWKKLASSKTVQLLPPMGYFDFLILMKNCELMLTDSGGIQEEATAPPIKKFVLVLRLSTERPEAVEAGFAKVVGVDKNNILRALNDFVENPPNLQKRSPFGDGKAGEKITKIVMEELG